MNASVDPTQEGGWRKPLLPAANSYASTRKPFLQGPFASYERIPTPDKHLDTFHVLVLSHRKIFPIGGLP